MKSKSFSGNDRVGQLFCGKRLSICYNPSMKLTEEQKQRVKKIGERFDLKLIILYGSYASDAARDGSDLDIAVSGRNPIGFETQLELYSALAEVFGGIEREIDLVTLEKKDPLFLYQVGKNSQLLYGDLTEYNEFRAMAFIKYFDSNDLFRLERKLVFKYQDYLDKLYAR